MGGKRSRGEEKLMIDGCLPEPEEVLEHLEPLAYSLNYSKLLVADHKLILPPIEINQATLDIR